MLKAVEEIAKTVSRGYSNFRNKGNANPKQIRLALSLLLLYFKGQGLYFTNFELSIVANEMNHNNN